MTNANIPAVFEPKVVETERLWLRPLEEADLPRLHQIYSNADVMRGWGMAPNQTLEDTRKTLEIIRDGMKAGESIRWAICEKSDPEKLCGDVGFWRFVRVRKRGELGAKLLPEYWNRGWMTECLSAVIEYGFSELGLLSVEGNIDTKNSASLRLVEKIGFERIGIVREHSFDPYSNSMVDTVLFSIPRSQWKGFSCQVYPPAH